MELKYFADIWTCSEEEPPDADTTVISRITRPENIGKVVEPDEIKNITTLKNYICIKPMNTNELLPKFLYYAMMNFQMQGKWRKYCRGSQSGRCQIRIRDVENIDTGELWKI